MEGRDEDCGDENRTSKTRVLMPFFEFFFFSLFSLVQHLLPFDFLMREERNGRYPFTFCLPHLSYSSSLERKWEKRERSLESGIKVKG